MIVKPKEYEVIRQGRDSYTVLDGNGKRFGFYKWRFEELTTCEGCTERHCNGCKRRKINEM